MSTFPGCSVGEFIASYFNTYYNAQRTFTEAEDEVWNQPDTKMTGRNYLITITTPPTAKTKFTSVIEKCSKLLQYHPESSLVDDALMMIGKSYFYQNEFQKAERKFNELMSGYPTSNMVPQARLLMACGFYKLNDRKGAVALAKDLVDYGLKNGEEAIAGRAALVVAQIALDDKNYADARAAFQQAADYAENPELRTTALLNLADIFEKTGDWQNAETSYRRAADASNNYSGEYKANIGVARAISRQGRYDAALTFLKTLRSNTNNKDFFGEIDFETGNVYRDMNDITEAIDQYIFVDTTYARTENSARSYYQLGLLYETRLFRYDSARTTFARGRVEFPLATVTPLIIRRSDYLNRYFQYRNDIARYDSMRARVLAPPDSAVTARDSAAVDTTQARTRAPKPVDLPLDSIDARLANAKSELAALFYATIGLSDSASAWYRRLLSDHPTSAAVPRALYTLAQIVGQDSTAAPGTADSLYRDLIQRFPGSDFAIEGRRILGLPAVKKETDPAEQSYVRNEKLFLGGNAVEAADSMKMLGERYPASPYAPRALYAAGWLYEQNLALPDSAIALFERLRARFPGSRYAIRVAPKLLEVDLKRKADRERAVKDSLAAIAPPPAKAQNMAPGDTTAVRPRVVNAPTDTTAVRPPATKVPTDTTAGKLQEPPHVPPPPPDTTATPPGGRPK
jgi:tetratricopeptide (TPR) repeat protein